MATRAKLWLSALTSRSASAAWSTTSRFTASSRGGSLSIGTVIDLMSLGEVRLRSIAMKTSGWLTGDIGIGWLIGLLAVLTVGALGGASVGGWGGVAIIAAVLCGTIGVIVLWAGAPPRDAGAPPSEQGEVS